MAERDIIIDSGNFPGNSNKDKEQPKREKKEKIVQSKVVKSKPSFLRKTASLFFKDAADEEDLKTTIIFDYLIPTVKDTVVEMGKMLLEGIFYGSTTSHRKSGGSKPYKVSYSDYYDTDKKPKKNSVGSSYNLDEIAMDSRSDAERVLDTMIDIIHEYKAASVADFCDLVGVDSNFTDYKYGWTDLSRTRIYRNHNGYVIDFPTPTKLD